MICLGKTERLECYGILSIVTGSFELHPYLRFTMPMPNDSNDYHNRLIYFSCNNYLTFHVFKTSFNEIMPQLLPFTCKSSRAF